MKILYFFTVILLSFNALSKPLTHMSDLLNKQYLKYDNFAKRYFGYPERSKDELMQADLAPFYRFHLNNVGDPWQEGNWQLHTKKYEREVIEFFANLYQIREDYWGYVTNGGTESNIFGVYQARKLLSQGKKPILLASSSTHYSILKAADILGVQLEFVASQNDGEISYNALDKKLKKYQQRPIILVLNLGTTMTGAMDSSKKVKNLLIKNKIKNYYIHVDAALNGAFYPWVKDKEDLFEIGVSSISISGHKFLGTITPCGIFLTKNSVHKRAFKNAGKISYISVDDTPFSSSRDGMNALKLWYLIKKKGKEGYQEDYHFSLKIAQYLKDTLNEAGIYDVIYVGEQIIVAFPNTSQALAEKYQLPIDAQGYSHIVCRPDLTKADIDKFIKDFITFQSKS